MSARTATAAAAAVAFLAWGAGCGNAPSDDRPDEVQTSSYVPAEVRHAFEDQDVPLGDTGLFEGDGHVLAAFIATDAWAGDHTNFSVVVYEDAAVADQFATPKSAPSEEETEVEQRANVVVYFPPSISRDGRRAIERALDSLRQ